MYWHMQKYGISAFRFRDTKTRKLHQVLIATQICIKPGSYKVTPAAAGQTVGEQIDASFNNSELEWSTKERGAMVLCALLFRVE